MKGARYNGNSPKPIRLNIPGHAHELTFSCYKRKPFLKSNSINLILAESINKARQKHCFEVWAYVFMPEHVHILLYPKEEIYSISDILKSIKQSSSRRIINHLRENKPSSLVYLETGISGRKYRFWQKGGGYDRNYYKPKEIIKQVYYIHDNPVRRGLVDGPEEWHWSSAGFWMLEEEGPVVVERENFPHW